MLDSCLTTFQPFAICLILTALQSLLAPEKHLARRSWSCKPDRRYLCTECLWFLEGNCIGLAASKLLYLSSMYDPTWMNESKSHLVLSSLACGLQISYHLCHKMDVDTSLGSKHQVWYISKPCSPGHLRGTLYFLVSGKLANASAKIFLHFSFQV